MKKYVWKYWFSGMSKPRKKPEGCELLCNYRRWIKDDVNPKLWQCSPRRWKVEVKTCKWKAHGASLIKNPHTGVSFVDSNMACCNTCGKPVEIVKKGAK